ncbi:MAG TPA: hypothetical protein VJB15_12760 [Rhodothermia bacterium]|nr:hypothetical protein [Rhodothermia bacterium]
MAKLRIGGMKAVRVATRWLLPCILAAALTATATAQVPHITLTPQESGTDVLLIGVSPVDEKVVWLSGAGGTVVRTTNGGESWHNLVVPGADSLQFRDVHAVDDSTAYVLSAGSGSASRIYKTLDAGQTWMLQMVNPGPGGFFDCFDFWDADHGIAFSDSYEGNFIVIETENGGATWNRIAGDILPPASEGEGSFASSGTCLRTIGDSTVAVGTGAGAAARLLRSDDRGATWRAFETPIQDGTATSGISSLSFIDGERGYAFGLELSGNGGPIQNAARTEDGGETWTVLSPPQLPDVYGGAVVPGSNGPTLVVAGPKGIDYSHDGGEEWCSLTKLDHWGLAFGGPATGWAVGPGGRITRLTVVPDNSRSTAKP